MNASHVDDATCRIRAATAQRGAERFAHTPDLYFLDITQFTTSRDPEIVGYLLLARAPVLTLRSKYVFPLLSSSSSAAAAA